LFSPWSERSAEAVQAVQEMVVIAIEVARARAATRQLLAETQRAVDRGTFGSPTFFVDDEIYFGKDRLRDVEEAIVAKK